MIIAHQLIETLGEERSCLLLALLESDPVELSAADREAFAAFLAELTRHYGPDLPALGQLRSTGTLRAAASPRAAPDS
ncbi:MAG TPA: hypothetical protein VK092_08075 [Deinococcales bacterium]|nr:hypothetical protein [Deinococcales bacterium]